MAKYAHVAGWGMYAPAQVLTNDDLAQRVETSDEWIRTRTGIVERRIAAPEETTATLAAESARAALNRGDISPTEVDAIIVATVTSDYLTPSTACLVQAALGAAQAAAFDVSAGCSGFLYALALARMGIASEQWKTVLVIGSETLSRFTNWQDRNTCVLFGDGAGALVLQAYEEAGGVLSAVMGADGSGADLLLIPAGGSRQPAGAESVAAARHAIQMDGAAVYRFATRTMPAAIQEAVKAAGLELGAIDLIVPHQANVRIIDSARKTLALPEETVFVNIERYGNTSAASIPIALCEAAEEGLIVDGSHLALVGFGAGLTWGAAVVRWGLPAPAQPPAWWKKYWQRARFGLASMRMRLRRWGYAAERHLPDPEK
jgi:3-oxoacyl-[acyl-carrier-protein] synthase-3